MKIICYKCKNKFLISLDLLYLGTCQPIAGFSSSSSVLKFEFSCFWNFKNDFHNQKYYSENYFLVRGKLFDNIYFYCPNLFLLYIFSFPTASAFSLLFPGAQEVKKMGHGDFNYKLRPTYGQSIPNWDSQYWLSDPDFSL